jgi:hypothetical protein
VERISDTNVHTIKGQNSTVFMARVDQEKRQHSNGTEQKSETCDRYVDAYLEYGSISKAAVALGISSDHFRKRLKSHCRRQGIADVRMLRGDVEKSITQSFLVDLIEKQQYRCAVSGIELVPEIASLDHIVPVSKGGKHVVDNVVWVHSEINRMKGQLSMDEFISFCNKVVQYSR